MSFGIKFTDYKIKSRGIFLGTVFTYTFIFILLSIAEIFIDLKATSIEIIGSLTAIILLIAALSLKYPENKNLHFFIVVFTYIAIEIHYILVPTTFHLVMFWFTLVPLMGLILHGFKESVIWLGITICTSVVNTFIVNQDLGGSYTVSIFSTPFLIAGSTFMIGFMSVTYLLYSLLSNAYHKMKIKNQELELLKVEVEQKKKLLEKYQYSIIKLSKNETLFNNRKNELYKNICREASINLNISQASIWLFENNNTCIVRKYIYQSGGKGEESIEKIILHKDNLPVYFDALTNKSIIRASDARNNPDTKEFKETYLEPQGILSMLDCPIRQGGKTIGVICCEQKHQIKEWTTGDELFVQSLADLISLNYKSQRIKLLLDEIKDKNLELVDKNDEINTINEELKTINNSLEKAVQHRTRKLENQNKQLTEYAFINSHLLRAPLSRVMGLASLVSKEVSSHKDQQLISLLAESTDELDAIIRKISDLLYKGNDITREEMDSIIDGNLNTEDLGIS